MKNTTREWLTCVVLFAASTAVAGDDALTYTKDIAPILFKECVACHRPGEVAPFSLLSYQDAAKRAKMLASVTRKRYMPPWKAEHGFGEFRDERYLTPEQIEQIGAWAAAGAPEGDPKHLPKVPTFESKDWLLGKPDMVAVMPDAYTLKADGPDVQRAFAIALKIPEDKHLIAFEFRPGNPQIVHHAIISREDSGDAVKRDAADPLPGFASFGGTGTKEGWNGVLGVWTPGIIPTRLPEGVGLEMKKGSDLVIQIHYHPSGKVERDQSSVALYFSAVPPSSIARYTFFHQPRIAIPAGEKSHRVTHSQIVGGTGVVLSVMPHMHLLGTSMTVKVAMPDGTVKPMVRVNDWDFRWQNQYFYATPLLLPKGARVELEAFFDNSADNPNNPQSPPKLVTFGEQTTNEMAGVIALVSAPLRKKVALAPAALAQFEGRYDFGQGRILVVKFEANRLSGEMAGKKAELLPESDTVFFTQPDEGIFTFKKDAAGKPASCEFERQGKSLSGSRI